jgi:hypothetical protein
MVRSKAGTNAHQHKRYSPPAEVKDEEPKLTAAPLRVTELTIPARVVLSIVALDV